MEVPDATATHSGVRVTISSNIACTGRNPVSERAISGSTVGLTSAALATHLSKAAIYPVPVQPAGSERCSGQTDARP